jgi:hypothetical protein
MKKKITERDIQKALDVILSDVQSYGTSLNWAINYVAHAKKANGEELKTQCLYILNNIRYWRHPKAKEVRKILRDFTKQK